MSSSLPAERGLRVPLRWLTALVILIGLAGCGGPDGSAPPSGAADAAVGGRSGDATPGGEIVGSPAGGSGLPSGGALDRIGGAELEVASYPVAEALAAEGGDAVRRMLGSLDLDPAEVELTLAVAPEADPTISDWRLPGAEARAILAAWADAAPGAWSADELDGVPALSGRGPDGSSAWALAVDGRFVYVHTADRAVAEEVATILAGD